MSHAVDGRRFAIASGAGALALAYLLPFRSYGFNVEDEGTLLYQILRVTRGELPYVDFSTGYTPGFFAMNAMLWNGTGDLVTFRTILAFLHAGTVAALGALLAGVARAWIAVSLPLVYLAFIPVFPGEFCAFNVAYPAWFATAGWLGTAGAMLAFGRRHARAWLVVAGVAAAVTLAMKPNAGVFAFAAAVASLLATARPGAPAGPLSAAVWLLAFVGIQLGVVVAFGVVPRVVEIVVHLVPLALAMAGLVTASRVRRPGLVADLAVLGAPFVALSTPWLWFFWQRLGTDGFLREVLLIGSGAADLYYVPFPALEPWGLLLGLLALAYAAAAFAARRWVMPRVAVAVIAAGVAVAFGVVARVGLMPEGLLWSMIWQIQSAAFVLTLGAQLGGIVWLWRDRLRPSARPDGAADRPTVVMLVLFAIFMHLQLYPRADFMHLVIAAPLALVLAGALLERVLAVWERALAVHGGGGTFRAVELGTAGTVLITIAVGLVPGIAILTSGPRFVLPFAVAPVGIEEGRAGDLRALAAASTRAAAQVEPGAPSLGFPSIAVTLFLTGARNPSAHDYFYPGRPDHREEAEILDLVAANPPAALATLNGHFTFFDAAQAYYFLLRRFVRATYGIGAPGGREGRFDVLVRDAPTVRPPEVSPGSTFDEAMTRLRSAPSLAARLDAIAEVGAHPAQATAPVLIELATGDDALTRRASLAALLTAITRAPDRGLEVYVDAARLDRRAQVLLLRTARDLRDGRTASYLFAAARSSDGRVRRAALEAMRYVRATLIARRYLWAGSEHPALWPARPALLAAVAATLEAADAPPEATAFAAHLAGGLADPRFVPPLRARLQAGLPDGSRTALADAATTASAADALVQLAPRGLACELTRLVARADAAVQELVPSRLIDLAEMKEPMRSEARRCIRDAIGSEAPTAGISVAPPEVVLWIAAALGDGVMGAAVRSVLGREDLGRRRAAAWTLGELPADRETATALAERAKSDPDAIVRRLAAGAVAKQAGRVPPSLPRAGLAGFPDGGATGYKTGPRGVDPVATEGPA